MEQVGELFKVLTGHSLNGNPQFTTYGNYACGDCGDLLKLVPSRARKQKTCQSCKGKEHSMSGTRPYVIWQAMKQRCSNPKNAKYHLYGGKGIKVCKLWETFEVFWEENSQRYADNLTIDRKDSSLHYDLENTRWIPLAQNSSETTKRRSVNQLTKDPCNPKDWIKVRKWESAKQAADSLDLVAAHITVCCQGKRKTHGGFAWEYSI